ALGAGDVDGHDLASPRGGARAPEGALPEIDEASAVELEGLHADGGERGERQLLLGHDPRVAERRVEETRVAEPRAGARFGEEVRRERRGVDPDRGRDQVALELASEERERFERGAAARVHREAGRELARRLLEARLEDQGARRV